MPTTAQPAAGTVLPSTALTAGLVWARNDSETNAATVAAGSATHPAPGAPATAPTYATDGDGRYKLSGSTGIDLWSNVTAGPAMTMMAIVKFAGNGASQALIDSDAGSGSTRNHQFLADSAGHATFLGFNTVGGVDVAVTSTATLAAGSIGVVIVRIRLDTGTYKALVSINGVRTAESAYTGTPAGVAPSSSFAQCSRVGSGQEATAMKTYFGAMWNRAISDSQLSALEANGWAVYDAVPAFGFSGVVPSKNGVVGVAFAFGSPALSSYFSSGTTPYTYAVTTGTLPAGLSINSSTGVISGTPSAAGTSGIVVTATDAASATAATNSFNIVISASATVSVAGRYYRGTPNV